MNPYKNSLKINHDEYFSQINTFHLNFLIVLWCFPPLGINSALCFSPAVKQCLKRGLRILFELPSFRLDFLSKEIRDNSF